MTNGNVKWLLSINGSYTEKHTTLRKAQLTLITSTYRKVFWRCELWLLISVNPSQSTWELYNHMETPRNCFIWLYHEEGNFRQAAY